MVGIRELQKDDSAKDVNWNIDQSIIDPLQDSENLVPEKAANQNPMLLFSLDTEVVVRTNEEWAKFISPVETNCPMSQVLSTDAGFYESFFEVLTNEMNNLHFSEGLDRQREVQFEDIPLAHFEGSCLRGQVTVFEDENSTFSFGVLVVELEDVLGLRLLRDVPGIRANFMSVKGRSPGNGSPGSRSPRSGSPRSLSRNSSQSASSNNSRRSSRTIGVSNRDSQPGTGLILELRDSALPERLQL